jgi:hypothetical protein
MAEVIEQVGTAFPTSVEVRDVDGDADLLAEYSDQVPVLLVNGRKAFKFRVTARDLERRLRAERRRQAVRRWRARLSGSRPT